MPTTASVEQIQELSKDQDTARIEEALKGAKSDEEIRDRLNTAGFDGSRAGICSWYYENERFFKALVTVKSPLWFINVSITTRFAKDEAIPHSDAS